MIFILSDRDLPLLPWKPFWNFGDSRENLFESYGDSRENLFEVLAVVNIWSPTSSARGYGSAYGVATISRLLKIIGLFCKRAL